MTVQEQLLSLLLSSLKGDQVPKINSLDNSDYLFVFDSSTQKVSTILKTNLNLSGGSSGAITKIAVTIDNDGQTSVTLTSKPDNIDIVINRGWKHLGTDFSYNNQTGVLSYPSGLNTLDVIDVTGYQNVVSKSEFITITSNSQTDYYLTDKPKLINHLVLNRSIMHEGTDFTYVSSTGLLTITNTSFINQITPNSVLEARKIF